MVGSIPARSQAGVTSPYRSPRLDRDTVAFLNDIKVNEGFGATDALGGPDFLSEEIPQLL